MAKVLTEFDFLRSAESYGRRGQNLPWDEWSDGRIWQLERGCDFHSEATTLRKVAFNAAKKRGLKVRTHVDGNKLTMQFYGRG